MKSRLRALAIALIVGTVTNLFPITGVETYAQQKRKTAVSTISKRTPSAGRAVSTDTTANLETPPAEPKVPTPRPKVIDIPNDQLLPATTPVPKNHNSFSEIGRGTAILFTPDLPGEANRQFYEALGFLYMEDTSWQTALDNLLAYNASHKERPIVRLLLETHGNWGNGLKLQDGKVDTANRSYISLGALQERLEKSDITECIISACNSGRLYRPEIYRRLNPKDLLPANKGVINASPKYRPTQNAVKILRRRDSRFEAMTPLYVQEMPRILRDHMGIENGKAQIIVSDLFLEYVLSDPNLNLIEEGFVRQVSIHDYTVDRSADLIDRFLQMLVEIASVEEKDHKEQQVATGK